MLDINLLVTMGTAVALVGGATFALWLLPWSEAELREADADVRAAAARLAPHAARAARLVPVR